MKTILAIIFLLATTTLFAQEVKKDTTQQKTVQATKKSTPTTQTVYICNGQVVPPELIYKYYGPKRDGHSFISY